MTADTAFEIFFAAPPGLEDTLRAEIHEKGFNAPKPQAGGVTVTGGWHDVWRANLEVRGATRVLARIGAFRVVHLSQLDKLARRFAWGDVLRADVPVRVEASCKRSRIYHDKAAAQRIETAIAEELGAPIQPDAAVRILARIEDNVCTLSVDTSGEPLHRRGHKTAVAKAPIRETMAALFLRECGYGGHEPVVDPMCGSGTFVIEAAEIAAGLAPGRSRRFAFEQLAGFDAQAYAALRAGDETGKPVTARFYGYDRDAGAMRMSTENAERAGVASLTQFRQQMITGLEPPEGPPGLVIVNPPYGARIGDRRALHVLYSSMGAVLRRGFAGWRVGLVTSDGALAKAAGLPFGAPGRPVDHGGLTIRLYKTAPLE